MKGLLCKVLLVLLVLVTLTTPVYALKHVVDLESYKPYTFEIGEKEFEVKLFTVTSTLSASFTINNKEDPNSAVVLNFLKGESKNLDFDTDNYKETTMKLISVESRTASVEIDVSDYIPQPVVQEPAPEPEPEPAPEEEVGPVCGDGIVEPGENYQTCCRDAGCPEGQVCIADECKQTFQQPAVVLNEEDGQTTLWLIAAFVVIIVGMAAVYALHGRKREERSAKKHSHKIKKYLEKRKDHKPLHLKKKLLEQGLSQKAVEKAFKEKGIKTPTLKITEINPKKRKQLEFYIRQRLAYGTDPRDIIESLDHVGWDKNIVKDLIKQIQQETK